MAYVCWNALTYFKCGRLGHKSTVCHSITLLPSSSSPSHHLPVSSSFFLPSIVSCPPLVSCPPSAMASRILRFLENDLSAKTEEELSTEVIFKAKEVSQGDLLAALKVYFFVRVIIGLLSLLEIIDFLFMLRPNGRIRC
jgi:hypothetical protein